MILNEINYKMPIYKDCTLGEMLFVGTIVFSLEITSLSLLTKIIFGYSSIGATLTFISFIHLTKYFLGKLQKLKYGKPYGFYKQLLLKKLSEKNLIRSPYVTRLGKWSIRRER